ncbi:unnamed protein product [Oikopleura dioica]|uniref:Serine/threonine-protein kinase pim-1 n=1 Tax=Oikopleura dioica TaxID=34765 RepID=E4XQH2_OIKDI|nr:unnamed protein product [Oikopleura dioica]CBY34815.1 unnamed protein product [Oikopleura dioica]
MAPEIIEVPIMQVPAQMQISLKRRSDEGYNSDNSEQSENGISPTKIRKIDQGDEASKDEIEKEGETFKAKYHVRKVFYNSANGVIYTGFRKSDMTEVCIKQVPKSRVTNFANLEGRRFPLEFVMHVNAAKASHGVVKIYDWFERKTSYVLVMERPKDSVDLFDLSAKYGSLKEDPAKIIFHQIVKICKSLSSSSVFHRDIKDENILVDTETLEVKLIDFGCATEFDRNRVYSSVSGTPEFFPPEVFTENVYKAEPTTVWSLGTLLHVLIYGDIPFHNTEDIVQNKISSKNSSKKLSESCENLLKKMMSPKSEDRPSFDEILAHPWLQDTFPKF